MLVKFALRRSTLLERLEAAWIDGRLVLSLAQYAALLTVLFPEDFNPDDMGYAERILAALEFIPLAADASEAHARARIEAAKTRRREVGAAAARRRRLAARLAAAGAC